MAALTPTPQRTRHLETWWHSLENKSRLELGARFEREGASPWERPVNLVLPSSDSPSAESKAAQPDSSALAERQLPPWEPKKFVSLYRGKAVGCGRQKEKSAFQCCSSPFSSLLLDFRILQVTTWTDMVLRPQSCTMHFPLPREWPLSEAPTPIHHYRVAQILFFPLPAGAERSG